jgi:predicted oxidoreductase (fatty acid repression mutant protein)
MGNLTEQFSKQEVQMANKYMKEIFNTLALKEMQVRTPLAFHFTPVRMVIIKKPTNNKCWQGC